MSARLRCGLLPAALLALGFVLPAERVIDELGRVRKAAFPLRAEATLSGIGRGWPREVVLELHPVAGLRVQDDAGGRWLVRQGRLVAGSRPRLPVWVPEAEILLLQEPKQVHAWLEALGIDPLANRLARCGEADCFVLGGPERPGRLWLDKDRFEVARLILRDRRSVEFEAYRDWDGVRFPSKIHILDAHGEVATLTLTAVKRSRLRSEDFSMSWAGQSPPN